MPSRPSSPPHERPGFQTFLRLRRQCPDHAFARARSMEDVAMKPRLRYVAAAAAVALLAAPAGVTAQSRLSVEIDQAQRVQLRGPAGSVIDLDAESGLGR